MSVVLFTVCVEFDVMLYFPHDVNFLAVGNDDSAVLETFDAGDFVTFKTFREAVVDRLREEGYGRLVNITIVSHAHGNANIEATQTVRDIDWDFYMDIAYGIYVFFRFDETPSRYIREEFTPRSPFRDLSHGAIRGTHPVGYEPVNYTPDGIENQPPGGHDGMAAKALVVDCLHSLSSRVEVLEQFRGCSPKTRGGRVAA